MGVVGDRGPTFTCMRIILLPVFSFRINALVVALEGSGWERDFMQKPSPCLSRGSSLPASGHRPMVFGSGNYHR